MVADKGRIWAAIRSRLPRLRDELRQAVEADSYEVESAWFDHVARELADAVCADPADDPDLHAWENEGGAAHG